MKNPARNFVSFYYLGVSLIGLGLLTVPTFHSPTATASFPMQKQLTGGLFAVICVLGIAAGLSPSRCSRVLHFRESSSKSLGETEQISNEEPSVKLRGHHPTCGTFSSHVFSYGGRVYCAGCMGLVTGAILAVFGDFLYSFMSMDIGGGSTLVFWLGFVGVVCGLLQYSFPVDRSDVHFFLNVMFVLGAFFLLVGVNEVAGSLVLNLYFLALTIFWIVTRVALSQAEHRRMCSSCNRKPCSLSFD